MMLLMKGLIAQAMPEDTYRYVYTMDPTTFDYLYTYQLNNLQHTANFVDGLLEHDEFGHLSPAVAHSYSVNQDFTVFTFHLRDDVYWYTDEGEVYEQVTAQDFVTGLQHAADFNAQTLYLVSPLIAGLEEYVDHGVSFDEVGIKALDDQTLQYTLKKPTPYFHTLTTYSILWPVNQSFLESKGVGCQLGSPDVSTCSFGTTESDSILYNGAFMLKSYSPKSMIEYVKNPGYWDKDEVHLEEVQLIFYNESDPTSLFLAFDRGEISAAPVSVHNRGLFELAQKKYGDQIYTTDNGSTTMFIPFVFNRQQYHSVLDEAVDVSTKTEKQKSDTKKALFNVAFRQAILFGLKTTDLNQQEVGEALKTHSIRNLLSDPTFVPGYHQHVLTHLQHYQDVLYDDISLVDGQMAYYNQAKADKLMKTAMEELRAQDVEFPIHLEVSVNGENDMMYRRAQAFKQTLEAQFKDALNIHLIVTTTDHLMAVKKGSEINADLMLASAWSPDFQDPKTYLDILDPEVGDLLKVFGLNKGVEDKALKTTLKLYEFKALKDEANDCLVLDERYDLYAKAEAFALNQAYFIPYTTAGGSYAVSKIVPYSKIYASYGISGFKLKKLKLSETPITETKRAELKQHWEQKKEAKPDHQLEK